MNFRPVILTSFVLAATVVAQDTKPFQTPALLVSQSGTSFQRVWIVSSTKAVVRYRTTEIATSIEEARVSDYDTIYLLEPADYSAALDLYQARRYAEARPLFAKIKDLYAPVRSLENNPSTLAAFYEMECMRKLGDLEALSEALRKFDKSSLTRENQLRQLELYLIWVSVREAEWKKVETLVAERAKSRLPGDQRAQLNYCLGKALEGLERPDEAIAAYQAAMTVDAGASDDIARESAIRVMTILSERPQVKRAIQIWGQPEENTSSPGYAQLLQASAVAKLYEMNLGGGVPLPEALKDLPKFQPPPQEGGLGVAPPPIE